MVPANSAADLARCTSVLLSCRPSVSGRLVAASRDARTGHDVRSRSSVRHRRTVDACASTMCALHVRAMCRGHPVHRAGRRGAALLGGAGRPLALAEIAASLDLPEADRARHPAHPARRRVRRAGPRDTPLQARRRRCADLHERGLDRHDLRSRAMNWADSLAAQQRPAVCSARRPDGRCASCTTSSGPTARRSGCGSASCCRCTPRRWASACSAFAPVATAAAARAGPGALHRAHRAPAARRWTSTCAAVRAPRLGRPRSGSTAGRRRGRRADARLRRARSSARSGVAGPVEELFATAGAAAPDSRRRAAARDAGAGDLAATLAGAAAR